MRQTSRPSAAFRLGKHHINNFSNGLVPSAVFVPEVLLSNTTTVDLATRCTQVQIGTALMSHRSVSARGAHFEDGHGWSAELGPLEQNVSTRRHTATAILVTPSRLLWFRAVVAQEGVGAEVCAGFSVEYRYNKDKTTRFTISSTIWADMITVVIVNQIKNHFVSKKNTDKILTELFNPKQKVCKNLRQLQICTFLFLFSFSFSLSFLFHFRSLVLAHVLVVLLLFRLLLSYPE